MGVAQDLIDPHKIACTTSKGHEVCFFFVCFFAFSSSVTLIP